MLVNEFIEPKRRVNRVYIHCSVSDPDVHDNISIIYQPKDGIEAELSDFRSTTVNIP